jgi:lambda family phage tail tape measure protein
MMNSLADNMTDAIIDFVDTGTFEFEKFARSVLKDLMRIATQKLVVAAISTATSLIGIADGAAFAGGGGNMIQAYGDGGTFTNTVVDKPTMFRYGGGLGVMGEAGPEAIMPLQRGPDGKLGVSAQGGGNQRPVIDGRFVFQFDRENLVGDYLTTPEGGRALVKAVRENGEEIRAVLQ